MQRLEISSPAAYLEAMPPEQKTAVQRLFETVNQHIDPGFECVMNWGMIVWQVPLAILPDTYNRQPLPYLALAGQKNYISLYTMSVYQRDGGPEALKAAFTAAGKKLDMGKSCIRFKNEAAIPFDVLAKEAAVHSVASFVAEYRRARAVIDAAKAANNA